MMSKALIWILISGLAGGMIRGIVGVAKNFYPEKQAEFKLDYFLFSLLLSGFIGLIAGAVAINLETTLGYTSRINEIAFLAGYAGSDFIEGLYKLRFKFEV
jgi:hypothetical protein